MKFCKGTRIENTLRDGNNALSNTQKLAYIEALRLGEQRCRVRVVC